MSGESSFIQTDLEWYIYFTDIWNLMACQPLYLLTQLVFIFGGLVTFIHACINGKRWLYIWLAITINGLIVELVSFGVPNIRSYWHSQTPVIFFGRTIPLHIIFLYPCFYYQSIVAASLLNISNSKKPFAVGLLAVLIDVPYDIVGVKFLEWTWHDTDPNLYDRSYWVPWTSYFFHLTFAMAISMFSMRGDFKRIFISSLMSFPFCVIMFNLLYNPLHNFAGIHSQIIVIMLSLIYGGIIFPYKWPNNKRSFITRTKQTAILKVHLILHYTHFLVVTILGSPENVVSVGFYQTIGPCNVSEPVYTMSTKVLERKKYLCVQDYDEDYFDFHCVSNINSTNLISWYTVCGTPFKNRLEYVAILLCICFVAFTIFKTIYSNLSVNNKLKNN